MKPTDRAKLFSCIPANVISINLSKIGINTFELEDLLILKDTLLNLRTVYLSDEEISKITFKIDSEQRYKAIGGIFPNVKNVFLLDCNSKEVINFKNDHALRRFYNAKKFFLKSEIPSLQDITAFFIAKKRIPTNLLHEDLRVLGDNLGADYCSSKKYF